MVPEKTVAHQIHQKVKEQTAIDWVNKVAIPELIESELFGISRLFHLCSKRSGVSLKQQQWNPVSREIGDLSLSAQASPCNKK